MSVENGGFQQKCRSNPTAGLPTMFFGGDDFMKTQSQRRMEKSEHVFWLPRFAKGLAFLNFF